MVNVEICQQGFVCTSFSLGLSPFVGKILTFCRER